MQARQGQWGDSGRGLARKRVWAETQEEGREGGRRELLALSRQCARGPGLRAVHASDGRGLSALLLGVSRVAGAAEGGLLREGGGLLEKLWGYLTDLWVV